MRGGGQDPSNALAYAQACGFCGRRPTIIWLKDGAHFVVGCASQDCNAQPRTEPRDGGGEDDRAFEASLAAAVGEWNGRARHQLTMLG